MSTLLSDLLDDLRCPTVVKITRGRLDIPNWRTFGEGKCVTIFPPSKQLLVLNSTCYENVEVKNKSSGVTHRLDRMSFLSSKTRLKFYDKHCEGKHYNSIGALQTDFPRFISAVEDFFAFVEDENTCSVHKVAAGQILELYEVHHDHSSEDSELYENVRGPDGQILRCKIEDDGVEVMLPNSIASKVNLIASEDKTKYTIDDISERFSFPRNLVFCDSDLQSSMTKVRHSSELCVASETSDKMLLLCEVGRTNIEAYDERLLQCQDVFMTPMSVVNTSGVSVECCPGHVEALELFQYLYAKIQSTLDNGIPIYCIYGTEDCRPNNDNDSVADEDDNEDDDDKEDYTPMKRPDEFAHPHIPEKRHSDSSESSRSPSLRSTKSSLSTRSSRSSGSEISELLGLREDHGGSYVHINPDTAHLQSTPATPFQVSNARGDSGSVKGKSPKQFSPDHVNTQSGEGTVNEAVSEATGATRDQTTSCELQKMGISELCEFLNQFRLTALANACEQHLIDGDLITSLSDEDLRTDPFRLKDFELKKFKKLKEGWRPKL